MNPADPRNSPKHKERSFQPYIYTVETVSRLSGMSLATVRQCCKKIDDLIYVASFIKVRLARQSEIYPFETELGDVERKLWDNRWPVLDFYTCGYPGCGDSILAHRGFCKSHGGGWPGWVMASGYFAVLTHGKSNNYTAYHRLVMGCPSGMDVHHIDFNRWNNRRENLAIVTREEHHRIHQDAWKSQPSGKSTGLPGDGPAPEERLDPAARAREKQASRDADAADLASGRKTRAQLRAENWAFALPRDRVHVDTSAVNVRKIRR